MLEYVREVCGQCGNLRSVCSDPTLPVYPQRTMCYITAVKEKTLRQVDAKYGEAKGNALHPTDGMTVWASHEDLSPDDHFV